MKRNHQKYLFWENFNNVSDSEVMNKNDCL